MSLRSGKACADALERSGYQVSRIDVDRDIAATLRARKPDVALNVLHGRPGEDGTLQGLLEVLGIPYSHSGVLASALAMKKDIAKSVLKSAGVPVPGGMVAARKEAAKRHLLPPPYVIKPVAEGSSVGVFIVREDHKHPPQELTRADWRSATRCSRRSIFPARNHLRGDGRPAFGADRNRPDRSFTTIANAPGG
jgi:D-alanine-D-alanine ligase